MVDVWTLPGPSQLEFAATAYALTCKEKQQAVSDSSRNPRESGDSDDEDDSDGDTVAPRDIARCHGKDRLTEKFMDRLAEVFARQKQPPK